MTAIANNNGGRTVPYVSVVVTTYNRAALLKETVSSILSQTFTDFELIIVDNMSTDGTDAYVDSIGDGRVRYFKNQNNGIIAVNRNYGIGKASGRYVAFCDDDDLWMPDKLKAQTVFMDANPDVALTFGYARDFYCHTPGDAPQDGALRFAKDACDATDSFERLLFGNNVATVTAMVRKSCLDEAGLFDEDPAFRTVEDYELWLRLARKGAIACIPQTLGRYRLHSQSVSGNEVGQKKRLLNILEKFKRHGWLEPELARRAEGHVSWMIGNALLGAGESDYRAWYWKAVTKDKNFTLLLSVFFCLLPTALSSKVFRLLKGYRTRRNNRL